MAVPAWIEDSEARETQEAAQGEANDELAALIQRIPKVRVVLLGERAERLTIDGKEQALDGLGSEILVDPGIHVFEASAGEVSTHKEVSLQEGTAITVALKLEKPTTVVPKPDPPPPPPPKDPGPSPTHIGAYVALGVAGLAAIGTGITWGLAASLASDLEPSCPDDACDETLLGPDGVDDVDRYQVLRGTTIALGVVTGVAAAAGLTLLFLPSDEEGGSVAVRASPFGVSVDASF
jgi:hypothetical protein